jgi:hypothetical protein
MPSTLTPGWPAAIGQDGRDAPPSSGPPTSSGPRLVAVPAGWPPYDCETHGAACPAARAAAVAAANPQASGSQIADGAASRAAGQAKSRAAGQATGQAGPGPPGAAGHRPGQAAAWAGQFARVLVEVLAGARPPKQIFPWTTERVRAQIDQLGRAVAPGQRPRIRRIMTSRPTASVVEMTVVVSFGPRSRALAMRLEHLPARPPGPARPARPARWLCTEIETG